MTTFLFEEPLRDGKSFLIKDGVVLGLQGGVKRRKMIKIRRKEVKGSCGKDLEGGRRCLERVV